MTNQWWIRKDSEGRVRALIDVVSHLNGGIEENYEDLSIAGAPAQILARRTQLWSATAAQTCQVTYEGSDFIRTHPKQFLYRIRAL
jgi:hypothetical protein